MYIYFFKLIGQFFQDMSRQKMRTFFTVFGITWGTVAVVLLLAFGEGLEKQAMKAIHGLGSNIVIWGGGQTTKSYQGLGKGRSVSELIREEDAGLLKSSIPVMELISPEVNQSVYVSRGKERANVNIAGVYPSYGQVRNLWPDTGGRWLNELDLSKRRRVVFVGDKLRDRLFGEGSDAVGKLVEVNGVPMMVVGVSIPKIQSSSYMGRDRESAFIPFSTYGATIDSRRTVNRFICRARRAIDTPQMCSEIYRILGNKYKFDPSDDQALWMWDTTVGEQFMFYFFLGLKIFMGVGGVLTLLVGGIGVANIMYVLVRERRREIGIKSALGATPRMIMMQFMIETFFIVVAGGAFGFALSYGIVELFQIPSFSQLREYVGTPVVDTLVALSVVGVLGLVGFAAGWSPARRAAAMDPVKALEF